MLAIGFLEDVLNRPPQGQTILRLGSAEFMKVRGSHRQIIGFWYFHAGKNHPAPTSIRG
jgi:hypothetical protein